MVQPSQKNTMNARERRAAERALARVSAPEQYSAFLNVEDVRESIESVIAQFGCVLESLKAQGSGMHRTLEVVVDYTEDRTDLLSLDTLAEISGALSNALDEAEDGNVPYALEVSSPGATRALTEVRHWKRAQGRLLDITLESGEQFLARLDNVEEDGAMIRRKKQTKKGQKESYKESEKLLWEAISAAKVEIEFNH
ncbi:ribosome maturation factor RimP [Rothia sp. P6271]|uniref:ribosome maturation factor RimP n=1 Tax=unclassified Rothia (in: high G+C Gram-positive bacteria) TaxID=2689056 RepID=UPI003AC08838